MITLEQVKQLESRVKRAVDLIDTLREENTVLKRRLEKSESRLKELEKLIDAFRNDQDQIEQGIKDVLEQLNSLEDSIYNEQSAESPLGTSSSPEAIHPPAPSAHSQPEIMPSVPDQAGSSSPSYSGDDSPAEDDTDDSGEEFESAGQLDIF